MLGSLSLVLPLLTMSIYVFASLFLFQSRLPGSNSSLGYMRVRPRRAGALDPRRLVDLPLMAFSAGASTFKTVDTMLDRPGQQGKVRKSLTGINRSCRSTVGCPGGRKAAGTYGGNPLEDPPDGARAGVRGDGAAARLPGPRARTARSSSERCDILFGRGLPRRVLGRESRVASRRQAGPLGYPRVLLAVDASVGGAAARRRL